MLSLQLKVHVSNAWNMPKDGKEICYMLAYLLDAIHAQQQFPGMGCTWKPSKEDVNVYFKLLFKWNYWGVMTRLYPFLTLLNLLVFKSPLGRSRLCWLRYCFYRHGLHIPELEALSWPQEFHRGSLPLACNNSLCFSGSQYWVLPIGILQCAIPASSHTILNCTLHNSTPQSAQMDYALRRSS